MLFHQRLDAIGIDGVAGFLGAGMVGFLLSMMLFRFVISARCPKCGGGTKYRGGQPITYECAACGHIHETRVSEGE